MASPCRRILAAGLAFLLAFPAPAFATEPQAAYSLDNSPVAERGRVIASAGYAKYVDPDGWYNMVVLSADGVAQVQGATQFTYVSGSRMVQIFVEKVPSPNYAAGTAEQFDRTAQQMIVPGSSWEPKDLPISTRALDGIGDQAAGLRPVPMATWLGTVVDKGTTVNFVNAQVLTRRGLLRITCGGQGSHGQCLTVLRNSMRIERAAF